MRPLALLCCALALVACSKADDTPADTAAPAPAAPPPPAPLNLADVAGTWDVKGMNMAGDSTLITYVVKATADTTGWTITFPGRPAIPMRVTSVAGDSVTIEAGPYASALRKGMQVRTTGSMRLQGGKLMGHTTARYNTKTADSVLMLRSEGTKRP